MSAASTSKNATTTTSTVLPLSTLVHACVPQHPLIALIYSPVIARIATLEHGLLLSNVSILLQRIPGVGSKSILLLALVSVGGAAAKWREQWKAALAALGLAEAVLRGFNVLNELETQPAETGSADEDRQRRIRLRAEIKHLLCFWSLVSLVITAESWLVLPKSVSSTTLKSLLRLLQSTRKATRKQVLSLYTKMLPVVRNLWLQLQARLPPSVMNYPFPTLPTMPFTLPSLRRPVTPSRISYPQPHLISPSAYARSNRDTITLPELFFKTPVKYELFKILLLWTALRRDAFGASFIWDWILGPIYAVTRQRNAGRETTKVVKIVIVEEVIPIQQREEAASTSGRGRSRSLVGDVFGSPAPSTAPRNDQHLLSSTPHTHSKSSSYDASAHSYLDGTPDQSNDSTLPRHHSDTTGTTTVIATPDIPYRLTSLSHPIHARASSHSIATFDISPSGSPSRVLNSYATDLNGRRFGNISSAEGSWRGAGKDDRWD